MKKEDHAEQKLLDANIMGQAIQILQDHVRGKLREKGEKVHPFITISREFGCEGTDLAKSLTDTLNKRLNLPEEERWMYYDKAFLDKLAEDHNLAKEIILAAEGHKRGEVEQYLGKVLVDKPDDYEVFQYLVATMTTLAKRGNVVLIGRGAPIITQGFRHGIHVRVYAGEAFKVKRIKECMSDLPDDPDEIAAFIAKESKKRDTFVERFGLPSASDPKFYHLMLNNDKFTVSEMTEAVICFLSTRGF